MSIDRGEIERIAELARLKLADDELDALARECEKILRHFESVRQVDEGESAALRGLGPERAPPRRDLVGSDSLERGLAEMAPAWKDGFFLLPRLPALDAESVDPAASADDDTP